MATNDFVPVAPSAGANVLTQGEYLTRAAITTGYASGVAESAAINKSLRQGTLMAAVLAQLIVDNTGQNAVDDGTTATLLSNLKNAVSGRLLNVQVFGASGTYFQTPGTKSIIADGCGGGGGGGGAPATSASQRAVSRGGLCGAWARVRFTSGFSGGLPVTIGGGGPGGAAGSNNGIAGGATSLGSILSIPGGPGGAADGASTTIPSVFATVFQLIDPTIVGGQSLGSQQPADGTPPIAVALSQAISGQGGDSVYGRGGRPVINAAGQGGNGRGTGGSGAAQAPSGGGQPGGAGTNGILFIFEFG